MLEKLDEVLSQEQDVTDYLPMPDPTTGISKLNLSPTQAAISSTEILKSQLRPLVGAVDKSLVDVFYQEVGVRFFALLCKHIAKFKISVDGALRLIRYTRPGWFEYLLTPSLATLIFIILSLFH